ncbi:MAG: hypothetical protein JRC68_07805 [Deltaproteobacteria bacterium]|nr:hypothetical protein [Deltaproteobacteria bacterium]
MRYYLIDEVSLSDMKKTDGFLEQNAIRSELEKIFWVAIPEGILNEVQSRHKGCQPYLFSIEMGADWIQVELFIRSQQGLRCTCQSYCTPLQRDFIFDFTEKMIKELGVRT